jgi:cobalt/nickel transport system permease protein
MLAVAVVLVVQALLFADGGLTALGTNVTLIGVVTVLVGYAVTRGLLAVLPRRPGSVVPASAVGAFLSVPAAALVFTGLYAVGGAVPIPLGALATAMLGWHALIGIGEAVITAAVVGAVVAARPDLVYAARHLRPDLVLVDAEGRETTVRPDAPAPARSARRPLAGLLATTLVIAGAVSLLASGHPDGLEFVGERLGFVDAARDSAVAGSPFADYGVAGVGPLAGTAVAGLLGVAVTVAAALGVARLVARRAAASERRLPERSRA